jgi:hypothetical protein
MGLYLSAPFLLFAIVNVLTDFSLGITQYSNKIYHVVPTVHPLPARYTNPLAVNKLQTDYEHTLIT